MDNLRWETIYGDEKKDRAPEGGRRIYQIPASALALPKKPCARSKKSIMPYPLHPIPGNFLKSA